MTDHTDAMHVDPRDRRAPTPGLLGGRYVLGDPLGRGGMAEVLRGTDTRLGRMVAVKILRPDLARDPVAQGRFAREAHSAASLNAPTIVSVYDTGEDQVGDATVPWIVMEYVEGQTLRDVLNAEGPLAPNRAVQLVAEVCSALAVAHEAGIVHRDIKPGNVMLTPGGGVKVMDFGIARAATTDSATLDETAAILGTAAYLSPEQARGETVDARSDLYSTGCLLYELLTGTAPFTGDSAVAVAYQHVREEPVPPSHRDPELSPDLDVIVLTAMAKEPAARYQHAAGMRADLLRMAEGLPVLAVLPATPPETDQLPRTAHRQTQNRRLLVMGMALLVVLALVGSVAVWAATRDSGPRQVGVPVLVGRSEAQAKAAIVEAGLTVGEVRRQNDDEAAEGEVLGSVPAVGVRVDEDSTVDLTVSLGRRMASVPVVKGLSEAEAKAALTSQGFTVGETIPRDGSNVQAGTVIDVIPGEGNSLAAGSTVSLVVASGQIEVPGVLNLAQADAETALKAVGFQAAIVPQADPGPPGKVLKQTPDGATKAPRGSVVTLTVSVPPPPPPTTPPASPSTSASASPSASASASPPAP